MNSSDKILPNNWIENSDILSYPYKYFKKLQKSGGIHFDSELSCWLITSYDHIEKLYKNKNLSASAMDKYFEYMSQDDNLKFKNLKDFLNSWMVFSDSDYHQNLKKIFGPIFLPNNIKNYKDSFDTIAKQIFSFEPTSNRILNDMVSEYSFKTTAFYLGLPEGDFRKIKEWCNILIEFIGTSLPEESKAIRASSALDELREYHTKHIYKKKSDNTILKSLNLLEQDTSLGMFAQLLTGGYDPVTSSLIYGIYELVDNQDQLKLYANNSITEEQVTNEAIRLSTAFRATPRIATSSFTYEGREFLKGQRVLLMIAIGNRDESHFIKPDKFDIRIKRKKNLAFGVGAHYCIGLNLAKLQISIALNNFKSTLLSFKVNEPLKLLPSLGSTLPEKVTLVLK